MEEQGEVGLEYTHYDFLEESSQDIGVVLYLLHSDNWKENFIGLDQLRAINKYRYADFLDYWPRISDKVIELMDSIRSSISKNALVLLSEVFKTPREHLEMVAQSVVPLLLTKAVNEKSFLRSEALLALSLICDTITCETVAEQLLEGCFRKSGQIADIAFQHLSVLLPRLNPQISLFISVRLLSCKRQGTMTGTKEFLKKLSQTWPEFNTALMGLPGQDQEKINGAIQTKPKRLGGIRELIQKSRKENVQPSFVLEE